MFSYYPGFLDDLNIMLSSPDTAGTYLFAVCCLSVGCFLGALFMSIIAFVFFRSLSKKISNLKDEILYREIGKHFDTNSIDNEKSI